MQYFELILWTFAGLVIGSFINVCVDRIPLQFSRYEIKLNRLKFLYLHPYLKNYLKNNSLNIFQPIRSFCFSCGHQINWYENIPVISYFLFKGICSKCKTPIGAKIILTETSHGLFYPICGWYFENWKFALFFCLNFSFFWFIINFWLFSKNFGK